MLFTWVNRLKMLAFLSEKKNPSSCIGDVKNAPIPVIRNLPDGDIQLSRAYHLETVVCCQGIIRPDRCRSYFTDGPVRSSLMGSWLPAVHQSLCHAVFFSWALALTYL